MIMIKRLLQLGIWLGMWGIAYMLFKHGLFEPLRHLILVSGYVGTFLAGIMFSYSFSVAPGAAILMLLSQHQALWLSVTIGGAGALLGDLMVFNFIRLSDGLVIEKKHHEHAGKIERRVHTLVDKINKNMPKRVRKALLLP